MGVQASTAIVRAHTRMAWSAIIVPTVVRISIAIVVVLMVGTYEVRPELVFESSDGLHKIYALARIPQSLTVSSAIAVLRKTQRFLSLAK
jgi:hypothetical protein